MKLNNNLRTLANTSLLRILIRRVTNPTKVYLFLALLLSMLFLGALSAEAANHYVRQGAGGTGADWSNAYSDLPSSLTRGDTYYVADGSYSGHTFADAESGTSVITIKKATASDHGTSTGWNDSYGDGQAVFYPTIIFARGYYIFDGVTGGGAGSWDSGHGFKIDATGGTYNDVLQFADVWGVAGKQNTTNITVSHLEMEADINTWSSAINGGYSGLTTNNITMSNLYVHGFAAIHIQTTWTTITNWILQNSYFKGSRVDDSHHFASFRMDFADTVTIRNNIFEDFSSTGCIGNYEQANNISIYGNVFVHTASWAIGAYNGAIYTNSSAINTNNYKIYNNSFVNLKSESVIGFNSGTRTGNVFYNNIIYNTTNDGVPATPIINGVTRDYNWYYPAVSSGEAHGQNGSGNPFINVTGRNYQLTTATSAGISLASPFNLDAFGNTRGADGVLDRGAYEFSSTNASIPAAPMNLSIR